MFYMKNDNNSRSHEHLSLLSFIASSCLFIGTSIVCLHHQQQTSSSTPRNQQPLPSQQLPPPPKEHMKQQNSAADSSSNQPILNTGASSNHNRKENHTNYETSSRYSNNDDYNHYDNNDLRRLEWYRLRRMEDRMSFREADDMIHNDQPPQQQYNNRSSSRMQSALSRSATVRRVSISTTTVTAATTDKQLSNDLDDPLFHDPSDPMLPRRSSDSCVVIGRGNWSHFEGYDDEPENDHTESAVGTVVPSMMATVNTNTNNTNNTNNARNSNGNSMIFRQLSVGSDSGDDNPILSKQLEGEDLSIKVDRQEQEQPQINEPCRNDSSVSGNNIMNIGQNITSITHPSISPSITPPPHRTFITSSYEEDNAIPNETDKSSVNMIDSRYRTNSQQPNQTRLQARLETLPHISRSRSVPYSSSSPSRHTQQYSSTNSDYIQSNRIARSKYNASIMPNKLILIRHGQSLGNVDDRLYATTPDNAMPLTKLGWEQAYAAGIKLKEILDVNERQGSIPRQQDGCTTPSTAIHFIVSPYVRTVETFHGIVSAWCDPSQFDSITDPEQRLNTWYSTLMTDCGISWNEDPRIREQDFGNYQEPKMIQQAKRDRHKFGAFYFRFPLGESASDVFDRVSTFLDSLWRSFDTNNAKHYVLVTHGISIRVILARYFRYTIDQFHQLANPRNCEMVVLQHDGAGRLVLGGRYELDTKKEEDDASPVEYKYHPRLRVLPQNHVHKAKVRMKYGE